MKYGLPQHLCGSIQQFILLISSFVWTRQTCETNSRLRGRFHLGCCLLAGPDFKASSSRILALQSQCACYLAFSCVEKVDSGSKRYIYSSPFHRASGIFCISFMLKGRRRQNDHYLSDEINYKKLCARRLYNNKCLETLHF